MGGSLDYTGSFDPQKSDRDIDEGPAGIPLERYKSSYNNVVAAVNFTAESKGANFFRSFDFSASVSSEFDLIDRWRYRANSGNVPIRTAVEEGVFDMEVLPVRYEATLQVDNKPFYANAKAVALLRLLRCQEKLRLFLPALNQKPHALSAGELPDGVRCGRDASAGYF